MRDGGLTIWIVDAHRGYGKRFVVRADEKLTAFLELKAAILAEQRQKPLPCHPSSFALFIVKDLRCVF